MLGVELNGIFVLHAGLALAFDPVLIETGLVANVGESLGSAKVVRIESHPEYERYWLTDSEGRSFAAEITRADGIHQGLCEAQGLVLYPRADIVEGEPAPITVEPWCAVLANLRADQVRLGVRKGESIPGDSQDSLPAESESFNSRGLVTACGAGTLASLVWFVRRDFIRFAVVVLGALAVRLLAAEPMLWNGGGAGYEKLLLAWGEMRGAPYGPGFVAWMSPAVRVFGSTFTAVSWTNLCFSALTAGVMYRLAVLLAPKGLEASERKWFPRWVAVLAVIFPVAVFLSRTELMHVSAVAFGATAVLFAVEARNGSLLAFVSAAMAGFAAFSTRPDLGIVALPIAAFAFTRRSVMVFAVALVVVMGVAWQPENAALLQLERLLDPVTVMSVLWPRTGPPVVESAFQLFLHSAFTPAAWWGAALLGLIVARPTLRWPALVWVATAAPFVGKVVPTADAVRLQLFAQYGWILLVAVGLARIGPVWSGLIGLGAGVYQLSALPIRWAHHDEFDFLREVVPTLPAEAVISTSAFGDRRDGFIRVMSSLGPARWQDVAEVAPDGVPDGVVDAGPDGVDAPTNPVLLVYRSVGEPSPPGEAFLVRELPQRADIDVQLTEPPVVGFYRVP